MCVMEAEETTSFSTDSVEERRLGHLLTGKNKLVTKCSFVECQMSIFVKHQTMVKFHSFR